ncbi:signal peptidase I [Macellibacteroides fermentans]|uniref:signal peptidase I n=1 Tax=Macellibacteroides fermentans TaxID=879969 RepID=UPI00406D02F5
MNGKRIGITIAKIGGGALLLLAVVLGIRRYCIESLRISTNAMEQAILSGDYVLVNKLPTEANPGRNRVILFKSPLRRDSVAAPLFVSRLIGMPGDTVTVEENLFLINGKQLPKAPTTMATYFVSKELEGIIRSLANKLAIPLREWKSETFGFTFTITTLEEYKLREELPDGANKHFVQEPAEEYSIIVPKKGIAYRINETSLKACREILLHETNGKAVFRDNKLFLDGRETNFFYFKHDYYWVLSDHAKYAVDSRHLGFIPDNLILGNVWFCWKSNDPERMFKTID